MPCSEHYSPTGIREIPEKYPSLNIMSPQGLKLPGVIYSDHIDVSIENPRGITRLCHF